MADKTTGEKFYPVGSAEGIAEARRRIAKAKHTAAKELDMGGLGLVEVPEELLELEQLKVLYLGVPKTSAKMPYFLDKLEISSNALKTLPSAIFTALPLLAK